MQARVQQALSDGLAMSLRHRVSLARELIDAGVQRSRILVGRPAPTRALRRVKERPDDAEAIALMTQSAASLVADGYLAASYVDTDGREIVTAGQPLRDPDLSVALRGAPGAMLAWRDGFAISGRYLIADGDGPVGTVVVQVPLPGLDTLLNEQYRLGESGESGLCARFGEQLGCFPQARNPKVYFIPIMGADGEPLPMTRALAGGTGVALTQDYRGAHVMAAYAPVGDFGLAMVVKADAAEIYAPIRERLQLALPILAALVVAGTFLLRAGVRPLAARLAQSEREAQEQHRALESTMASVAEGIMLLDADGTIRSWNAAAAKLFGYSAEEVVGRNVSMLMVEELRAANIAATQRFLATGESKRLGRHDQHCPAQRKDGSRFELGFTLNATGGVEKPQLVAVLRDVTERKEAEKLLMRLALHDTLTGLPNRASFEQRIESALARCRRSGKPLALILLDLDNFKPVNDTLGHEVGDRLLVAFADRLTGTLRESDLLARLGGDEFTIVAEDLKGAEDAVAIAAKTIASLSDPLDVSGHTIRVSTSIGIALYREGDTPQTLMRRADQALYDAKGAGRARYRLAA
jgi:diguanylate cyclase (GGDEF)-like protein/PAS domain S-box-containing protein